MKILATIIFIYALPTTCIAKCTQEMVKAEYKSSMNNSKHTYKTRQRN